MSRFLAPNPTRLQNLQNASTFRFQQVSAKTTTLGPFELYLFQPTTHSISILSSYERRM
ncbi:hypothetical protein D1AOALGA4SA_8525 [Olavius algarvensis Delta 1 endosymbiont]|nr:hypothetical protein D1AOALGA4SA_8525 [Olavius algarvensis Delta 1 endosymbiont]